MQSIKKIRTVYHRFGIRGIVPITLSKFLRKPIEMEVHPPRLPHPVRLRTRTSDLRVYDEVITNRQYECDLQNEPEIIIDAGANIGLASIYFAIRFPDAHIVAIEPEKENFRLLQENTKSYKNIRPIQAALWPRETRVDVRDRCLDLWGFQTEENSLGTIPAITVSKLLRQHSIPRVDILKMDIEGAEYEVFAGVPDWISRVGILMIELHDQFKAGCSEMVYTAMANRKSWRKGEITFFS